MIPLFFLPLIPTLSLLPSVSAHGFITEVTIDGTTYTGNVPAALPTDSPIRQISDIGPVKGANNPSLTCGLNAQLATMVVAANPGSVMQFYWGNPGQGNWPHNTGPLMTYMALCDTSTCDKFNGSTAKWFKIDEIGKKSDGTTWYQQDVMNRMSVSVTLPNNVAPGDYLVRHEIIALHLAVSLGGAEFYPSCTQVRIGGSQTGTPNQTVSFPGAYNDNDPGIYDPDVYSNQVYVFPGPPVSNLFSPADMSGQTSFNTSGSGSSPSGGTQTSTTAARTSAKPTSTGSAGPPSTQSSSSRYCKLQKQGSSHSKRDAAIARHKHWTGYARAIRDAFSSF